LERKQQFTEFEIEGIEHLTSAVRAGHGVLIVPNHSAHYDSACLYVAADSVDIPLYMMAAWQVFAMSRRWECFMMQRLGCFSIDRESTDRQAFKQAIEILEEQPYPLVIFPEGDIYHTNDRVTPFREGAAAIALSAAKKAQRKIVAIPCGLRFSYLDDPSPALHAQLAKLEERLCLRPLPDVPLVVRVHRFAEAALAIKELDYLGRTSAGRLRERIITLTESVLNQLEQRHEVRTNGRSPPERAKELRRKLISQLENEDLPRQQPSLFRQLQQDMDDVFFVMQCFSYPGDYLIENPTVERLAETIDKFEEDVFNVDVPGIRGRRRVRIRFGEPIEVIRTRSGREQTAELTQSMQDGVQKLLDAMSATNCVPQAGSSV
jgi:1-acyl-sn-glycerol-3-phosphate acyltransferase